MTNVDDILQYKRKEEEDYYAILGCDEHATVEQITAEYKVRALQYHPDKNPDDQAQVKFQLLNEAKETLCDPEKRNNYDKWRNSGIAISYKQWLGMKEHVHQSMHWSTPKTKDRMLETGGVSSGPSSLGAGGVSAAHRRASEGGANLHWSGRGGGVGGTAWSNEAPSEPLHSVMGKSKYMGTSSGPSSLTTGTIPAAHRRASEGGAHLYMHSPGRGKNMGKRSDDKNKEI